jgi:hypothetical protein
MHSLPLSGPAHSAYSLRSVPSWSWKTGAKARSIYARPPTAPNEERGTTVLDRIGDKGKNLAAAAAITNDDSSMRGIALLPWCLRSHPSIAQGTTTTTNTTNTIPLCSLPFAGALTQPSASVCAPLQQGEHISGGVLRTFDRTKSPVVGERDHPSIRWMDNKSKKGVRIKVFHLVSCDRLT